MTNAQQLETVRTYLETWFSQSHPNQKWSVTESILIRGGHYCGRRFAFDPYSAIWFVEENELKVFAANGEVVLSHDFNKLDAAKCHEASSRLSMRRAA